MNKNSNIINRSKRIFWEKEIAWTELRWESVPGRVFQMGTEHGVLEGEK